MYDKTKCFSFVFSVFEFLIIISCGFCENAPPRMSPTRHYRDMGCSPLPDAENIQAYSCLFEALENPAEKCTFKGNFVELGEKIPDAGCSTDCFCDKEHASGQPGFTCLETICNQMDNMENSTCIPQYSLDSCCIQSVLCDADQISNLHKCEVGSVTYLAGERFRTEGSCRNCVCNEGYDGVQEAPHCKPIDCGVEKLHIDKLLARCAPIYYQGVSCCPDGWECYESTTQIIRSEAVTEDTPYQCTFGSEKLNIGDQIVPQNTCVTCSCDYPPLVTCIRRKSCIDWTAGIGIIL